MEYGPPPRQRGACAWLQSSRADAGLERRAASPTQQLGGHVSRVLEKRTRVGAREFGSHRDWPPVSSNNEPPLIRKAGLNQQQAPIVIFRLRGETRNFKRLSDQLMRLAFY